MAKKRVEETFDDDKLAGVSPPEQLFIEDEEEVQTTLRLPRAVVYALLDPTFDEADVKRAYALGLLNVDDGVALTELGERVLNGCDVTALRHKLTRAYRAAEYRRNGGT